MHHTLLYMGFKSLTISFKLSLPARCGVVHLTVWNTLQSVLELTGPTSDTYTENNLGVSSHHILTLQIHQRIPKLHSGPEPIQL